MTKQSNDFEHQKIEGLLRYAPPASPESEADDGGQVAMTIFAVYYEIQEPKHLKETVMAKILKEEDIQFEKVAWGLTKELVNTRTVGAKKLKVKITEWLPGHIHKKHVHPDQEEVIFVLSGKGMAQTEEEKREIGPGSVVFIGAGEQHTTWNLSDTESLRAVVIKAPPEDEEVPI
ncbi:MAG: cupin domain-containing protein [Deltaproteobacteria bacterium]